MVGLAGLDNIASCVGDTLDMEVLGDLMETGVWRGGSCTLMKALLAEYESCNASSEKPFPANRHVWMVDSFQGLPPASHPDDRPVGRLSNEPYLAVLENVVRDNFRRYGLLDERVLFVKG